ncbi:unnamed protein product, partial [Oppiella nova]
MDCKMRSILVLALITPLLLGITCTTPVPSQPSTTAPPTYGPTHGTDYNKVLDMMEAMMSWLSHWVIVFYVTCLVVIILFVVIHCLHNPHLMENLLRTVMPNTMNRANN